MIGETRFGRDHEFIRIWTTQLYAEFSNICFHYRLKLRPPVIRVIEMKSRWGTWDPNSRTITLARQLIEQSAWDATVEVLKHEIAHMIVNEEYGVIDHTHGDAFKQACRKIGIAPWAQASEADLTSTTPGREKDLSPTDEKLLQRVSKLLALAESPNENEALLAMKRVREIYSKYNLERLRDSTGYDEFTYVIINHKKKQVPQHQAVLAGILTAHFFVEVIFANQYDPSTNDHYKVMEIVGTRHNVKMAEYVYNFLLRSLESLWDLYRKENTQKGQARRSYYLGVLKGFDLKLQREATYRSPAGASWQLQESTPESRHLAVLADQEIRSFVHYRHPRLVSKQVNSSVRDQRLFEAGKKEGTKLVLRKAMHSQGSGKVHQLN